MKAKDILVVVVAIVAANFVDTALNVSGMVRGLLPAKTA